jgi:hypothetical protein
MVDIDSKTHKVKNWWEHPIENPKFKEGEIQKKPKIKTKIVNQAHSDDGFRIVHHKKTQG